MAPWLHLRFCRSDCTGLVVESNDSSGKGMPVWTEHIWVEKHNLVFTRELRVGVQRLSQKDHIEFGLIRTFDFDMIGSHENDTPIRSSCRTGQVTFRDGLASAFATSTCKPV